MKPRFFVGVVVSLALAVAVFAARHDSEWEQVDAAAQAGLPKTAIERLDPIIKRALAEKAYPEAIKAITRKIALEGAIQGNKPEERIVRLQTEIAQAPAPMHPVMEAILAHWYWQYFQQNRWRFLQRTSTAESPGADIQTWDLRRILAEIDRHFSAALANEAVLKDTPISTYDALLEKGTVPDDYRPTLFDFLAYDALQFYQAPEHGVTVAEDEFEISADGPIFAPTAEFVKWRPVTSDTDSPKLKAVRLYQALLKFHGSDRDLAAFHDADFARLRFGYNSAVGEDKDAPYQAALKRFIDETADHEISARATAELARLIFGAGNPLAADDLARAALRAFPESAGGVQCYNLVQRIESPSVQIETEQVWNGSATMINVTYRNVSRLYFRAVAMDFETHVKSSRWGIGAIVPDQLQHYLAGRPSLEWTQDLAATKDYKDRTQLVPAPTSLKPGYYLVAASGDREFRENKSSVSAVFVWVSDLALVLRRGASGGGGEGGFVLKATSGEPIANARVQVWRQDREGWLKPDQNLTTDVDGRFALTGSEDRVVVLAESDGQAIASRSEFFIRGGEEDDARRGEQTVFFTDRSIYRPGQTIHYKGVTVRYDQNAAKYSIHAGVRATIVFNDPNGREIERTTQVSNEYGSFSGVFTAPRDRLTGEMTITVLGGTGSTNVRVEEYKRPKFHVELKPPSEAAKLGAAVEIVGKATAYTGAGVTGAQVKWRIVRNVQLPYWCWWWQPPSTKAIAHGTATADADGTFKIEFTAEPDRSVPAKNEPVFAFTAYADVTDTTGETRSEERTVRVGYTALQAAVSAEDWQTAEKPVEFTITTRSLNGDPQAATGKLLIEALKQPATVPRPILVGGRYGRAAGGDELTADPANPDGWPSRSVVTTQTFTTDAKGEQKLSVALQPGVYRASLQTHDRFGREVTARQTLQVLEPTATQYSVRVPEHLAAPKWTAEPGDRFRAVWGTGYPTGRAFVELECNGKILQHYWTNPARTQQQIELPITESMRGGVTLRVSYVRENRAYLTQQLIDVPWTNKELAVTWEHFRSKLTPGQQETWTAVVKTHEGETAAAEMVAALYDASLDQFAEHDWPKLFDVLRHEVSRVQSEFQNNVAYFQAISGWQAPERRVVEWRYREFPENILGGFEGDVIHLSAFSVRSAEPSGGYMAENTLAGTRLQGSAISVVTKQMLASAAPDAIEVSGQNRAERVVAQPELSKISARRNLNETAFFFPHLTAGKDGLVKITFTIPEALTEWKFLGFAHDAQLRAGYLTDKVVTAKELMVEPNAPRFIREGDMIEFTVKVTNTSASAQSGEVRLTFADAATEKSVDAVLGNGALQQRFDVPSRQSRSYSWRISVPDGIGFLTYKAIAATSQFSDGEEGFLPVLSRRVLVTESLPLPIRGKTTKEFEFKKLLASGTSDTLRQQSLTVQMTSQPAWYAVMALPYLMEYPYECSEQVFNRYYANALARHIANSDPKIRRIFDRWKNTPALQSPLEKNQDLKAVALEETPWVRDAAEESAARRNVGLLFDANQMDEAAKRALQTLSDRQLGDGLWSWFPGGRPSEYISLYIMTGFGRLRHLGIDVNVEPALKTLTALDSWLMQRYREIQKLKRPAVYVPSYTEALFLYGRSFFLHERPIAADNQPAFDFFVAQARTRWLQLGSRQCQAQLALALQRFGDVATAQAIVRSLKERSITDDELGMYWRDTESSWWWYDAPIETQAMMIEAFDEVAHDAKAVEDCRVWLLKQKQTQDWRTTKATADAAYGLLLHGSNLLASDELVRVALGGMEIKPQNVEAGTGFYEQKYVRDEIKPDMGHITVTKTDDGVSWGSVHWQYLEDMAKVTPHEGTPLKLKKTLWTKETTSKGQVLKPVTGPVSVGDELVVRIELHTDRDMEFVHLKDQRGSGTEPVNVLSRYKYQDGLAYYESTRDTATHFFIDYLPKGTYVFEYATRVQLKGRYQTGIAEIQCMYAPEFNSHSKSIPIAVK